MRIAKVALAFFSIGFAAGSFEQAASLGHTELERAAQERHLGGVIIRSAAAATASLAPLGALPDELVARALTHQGTLSGVVAAALPALGVALGPAVGTEFAPGEKVTPVVYGPHEPAERGLTTVGPIAPDLGRPKFGIKRMSEPDWQPRSRTPDVTSVSLPPSERWETAPKRDAGTSERGIQDAGSQEFILPFERGRVTSLFNQGRYHPAIDLAGPLGSRVQATTRRQRVIFTGWRNGYGNTVVTRDDGGRMHLYGHLQRVATKVGVILEQGQLLGALGSTGRSTGPHVHYEVKSKAGAYVDPVTLLFGRRVGRGFAWNGSRSVTRVAARMDGQPRPR